MAFNPFTSFRKYQKFWMATILLVCMLTFVLCTGVGGDLSDRILRWFGGGGGRAAARLYSRSITDRDLRELKMQRAIANLEVLIKQSPDKAKKSEQEEEHWRRILKQDLEQRLKERPRYFEGTN